jgi:hypothetical protein
MAAVQTAMVGRLPYTELRDAIFAHPTISEGPKSSNSLCSANESRLCRFRLHWTRWPLATRNANNSGVVVGKSVRGPSAISIGSRGKEDVRPRPYRDADRSRHSVSDVVNTGGEPDVRGTGLPSSKCHSGEEIVREHTYLCAGLPWVGRTAQTLFENLSKRGRQWSRS